MYFGHISSIMLNLKWATTCQNQQNECASSKDSDQPGHPPSLIRVFAVRMKKLWVLSYPLSAQWRPWSDWADAQADLSLRWAHTHFVGFVMSRLIWFYHPVMPPKHANIMANSVDPDQIAPSVWSESTLFVQTSQFEYLWSLRYIMTFSQENLSSGFVTR